MRCVIPPQELCRGRLYAIVLNQCCVSMMSRMLEFLVNACLLPAHQDHAIPTSSRPSLLKRIRISATPYALVVISLYAVSATACTKAAISSKFQEFLGQPQGDASGVDAARHRTE